jgi:Dienelactone hydrolase family
MTDDPKNQPTDDAYPGDITRRDSAAHLVGAGLATTVQSAAAAGVEVIETDVEIKTPDGICDAAFIRPKPGSHPGVLIWPDAFGLRPSMRAIARRIASEGDGYSVLVPNPFYCLSKAPFTDASTFNFQNADDMAQAAAADGVGERARQCREGCHRLRCLPRRAKRSEQGQRRSEPRVTAWAEPWLRKPPRTCPIGLERAHRSTAEAW